MISPTPQGPVINDLQYRYFYGWQAWPLGSAASGSNAPLTGLQTIESLASSQYSPAGALGGFSLYNPNASVAYIQAFDSNGTVTLGTTAPNAIFVLPATTVVNMPNGTMYEFFKGIQIAATTTANGSTLVGSGLTGTIFYQ